MKYNLFIKTLVRAYNIIDVNDDDLQKIVENYNYGEESFFIHGEKYYLKGLSVIKIFTVENQSEKLLGICENQMERNGLGDKYIPVEFLEKIGQDMTDNFIKGDYGYLKDE